ncbi:MAG TPA: caspase family protein [Actinomycetota bacterium]|nr:caspase family protein [Actinomycetota bacterium]
MRGLRRTWLAASLALASLALLTAAPTHAGSAHDRARQIDGQPNSFYWAVLVGIDDYQGNTPDLTGSVNDVRVMRDHLLSLGWRNDHIYVVTDKAATRDGILRAIRWLASKTNNRSAAIFHFSGHEWPMRTTADGDDEARDVAIRTHENKFIIDGDLGREMDRVVAHRFWIDMSLCRAGGFTDRGMIKPGRVLTFSSPESQLSYEDPSVRHSVFSYYAIAQGMRSGHADKNGDGQVSVEEAFWYSRMPVINRTDGRQHPEIIDKLAGDFSITPPAPKASQEPRPTPSPTPSRTCVAGICLPAKV